MNGDLSPNAQAILLLTAPLIAGKTRRRAKPLSLGEYRDLARHLREMRREPADLLEPGALKTLHELRSKLDLERIHQLLARGFLLAQAVERWRARAIWVVTRADSDYPQRLKRRMKENSPPVLYGCGDPAAINEGGLAVVGSRKVSEELIRHTEGVGHRAAEADISIVSGGARGIDQAAMRGALAAGGRALGILANGLERAALNRDNRPALMDGRLVLVCPYDPSVRFLAGYAMQRNKLIYALADAALVMNSDHGHGGTWAGATEQLGKLRFVRVYVRRRGDPSVGLDALVTRGAERWPDPQTPANLREIVLGASAAVQSPVGSAQQDLFPSGVEADASAPAVREKAVTSAHHGVVPADPSAPSTVVPASTASKAAKRLVPAISGEMTRQEILKSLGLQNLGNLRERYLKPCLREGWIEETKKPRSKNQRFRLTETGQSLAESLEC